MRLPKMAFAVLETEPKIAHIPDWVRITIFKLARILTGRKTYGRLEFTLTVMDMVAPQHGQHTLKAYFTNLKHRHS